MFGKYLEKVRTKNPLVHCMTNFVTANDCANILIATGASPIMANEYREMYDISKISDGLNINLGTINKNIVPSMLLAARISNKLSVPVVIDLVGISSSKYRLRVMKYLMKNARFTVIKGNISEIKTLITNDNSKNGIDAREKDKITYKNLDKYITPIKKLSKKLDSIIVITGEIDIVTDGKTTYIIENGNKMMADVSGSGCMLSALITAFIGSKNINPLESVVASVIMMGIAGEIAYNRMTDLDGNSSYRNYLIDAIYNITPENIDENAKYEII